MKNVPFAAACLEKDRTRFIKSSSFDSVCGQQSKEVGWKYLKYLFNAIVKLCSARFKNGYKIMPDIYMISCWLFYMRLFIQ